MLIGLASLALSSVASGQCTVGCDVSRNNTYQGAGALPGDSGSSNSAFGALTLNHNTTGTFNTAIGADALISNTSGSSNNGLGTFSLYNNTTGSNNTGVGNAALSNNTTGSDNTAVGFDALDGTSYNTALTGSNNTAEGYLAMTRVSGTASYNTGIGSQAMENTTSDGNTGVGFQALYANTTGYHNTATGSYSLLSNTTGSYNTADGSGALIANTRGLDNTAIGNYALGANTTGSNNIALGYDAGDLLTTGGNNIDIGNVGVANESNTIRIGTNNTQFATFVAGVSGIVVAGGQTVVVNSSGQLGVTGSSARFKEAIQPMDDKSESILSLRPVSFRYKKALDPKGAPQFGLIAEDVAKIDPDLVVTDNDGKPFSVRYQEVNAMLLNEFLKEHRRVTEQDEVSKQCAVTIDQHSATINELHQILAHEQSQIDELTRGLQRVSDKLDMAHLDSRLVTNH